MSIRSRLLGGNFMVFSVFFIVFTVAFARCLHDKGWLLKPCSCSANQIFSRDPAEKLAGFSTWDLLETEIKLRVLLEQHNYIFFGAMLSFDELFECLVLLIACRMSGNFSWQTAVLHWPFLRPMIAWLELTIADVHEYAEMMNRSISDDQERQVALSMEHHGCPPGPPFSAISISVLHWFRRMWQRVSHDSMFYFQSGSAFQDTSWLNADWSSERKKRQPKIAGQLFLCSSFALA